MPDESESPKFSEEVRRRLLDGLVRLAKSGAVELDSQGAWKFDFTHSEETDEAFTDSETMPVPPIWSGGDTSMKE
jgi:hypothetical protein